MPAISPPPPRTNSRGSAFSSTSAQPDGNGFRGRLSSRAMFDLKSPNPGVPPLSRRRSSILSFGSLEASDFIRPGLGLDKNEMSQPEDHSHWHSSPLAFALLPGLAGLFFANGSAFVTDILLLGLAALFLNWSVTLPWDWYRSAQTTSYLPPSRRSSITLDEVVEGNGSSNGGDAKDSTTHQLPDQDEAAADAALRLRHHEVFALISTFAMPIGAAYLLHIIRAQLSRPSEGLVSDYNLTIFLLAAEIRPVRQLIRLFTNRTLHLQRVVGGTKDETDMSSEVLNNVLARIDELETRQSLDGPASVTLPAHQQEMASLSADIKRRYEPRLDALERAVRRYEKRATTLTLLTEQRLQSLEARLQDALSLAAVAAQSSTHKSGFFAACLNTIGGLIILPFEALWLMFVWPVKAAELVINKTTDFIYGKPKRSSRKADSLRPQAKSTRKRDEAYFGRQHL